MRRDEWARLAAPFPASALIWCVAKLDSEAGTALVEPVVAEDAVSERLDRVLGVGGWSKRLSALGPFAVVCELELLGVRKSAAASSFQGAFDMARVSAWACGRAAALLGLKPPARSGAWVDFDAEAGEPLYLPDSGTEAPPAEPEAGVTATPTDSDPSGTASAPDAPEWAPSGAGPEADVRSEGQQVIERLVERLKDEGLGREAASLVVEFGGYGRTADEARELYRRLRELLLEKGTPL